MKLLTIIMVWVAGWTPFAVIMLLQLFGFDHYIHYSASICYSLVCCCVFLSGVVKTGLHLTDIPSFLVLDFLFKDVMFEASTLLELYRQPKSNKYLSLNCVWPFCAV